MSTHRNLLSSLRSDAIFALRQLDKSRITSAAAILSLALAIGACTSAFRLIDALLLRPLPIAHPDRLYDVARHQINFQGQPADFDGWAYPVFNLMRDAAKNDADLIAISYDERTDITFKSDQEMEKAHLEYVSGSMFQAFGLKPALGRLFTETDDLHPGAHPYAVISYDYWERRFARDPKIIGRTFRLANRVYEVIGVSEEAFTGTEPGTIVEIFVPTMMNPYVERRDSTWHRTLAVLKAGASIEPLRAKLDAVSLAFERDRAKSFTNMSAQNIANYLHQTVYLDPAPSGVSGMQSDNRQSLFVLAAIVALVLLIACVNVANLMTAQAAARAREMALRISIGASRAQLVQLVLVQSAWLAFLSSAIGSLFAWWSAPFVVSLINPPDNPVRLVLPADWRVLGFGIAVAAAVTFLFGVIPALHASATDPLSALKGESQPRSRRRFMRSLIAAQVAFCFVILFVSGLFVSTFKNLAKQYNGFSADRILTLDTVAPGALPVAWQQVADHLRSVPGVEQASIAGWPLLSGYGSNNSISVNGGPPSDDLTYFLPVSPGWIDTMRVQLVSGRDFAQRDTYPGAAIVNETFVRRYFAGVQPIGRFFNETEDEGQHIPLQIVGVVRDARYAGIRDAIPPVAYIPFRSVDPKGAETAPKRGTFIIRTAGANPAALATTLRREVSEANPDFRISNIRTQQEINDALTIRERLLSMLGLFFAAVALILAGVGLYGVLHYSVVQRGREFAIRIAIGAQAPSIARIVVTEIFVTIAVGASAGLTLGFIAAHYTAGLLYQAKPTDASTLAAPLTALLTAAIIAAIPPTLRAVSTDPAQTLRST
jgi:putative ABC transport system permease protein